MRRYVVWYPGIDTPRSIRVVGELLYRMVPSVTGPYAMPVVATRSGDICCTLSYVFDMETGDLVHDPRKDEQGTIALFMAGRPDYVPENLDNEAWTFTVDSLADHVRMTSRAREGVN